VLFTGNVCAVVATTTVAHFEVLLPAALLFENNSLLENLRKNGNSGTSIGKLFTMLPRFALVFFAAPDCVDS
jgi:hypothetical protein